MKDYVALLADSDLKELCRIISPNNFRGYFKTNSHTFNKLKPGFRAETLSDDAAIAVACDNKDHDFIRSFINNWVDSTLGEIEEYKSTLTRTGVNKSEADVKTYKDCLFKNNMRLYFLLCEKEVDESYLELLVFAMNENQTNDSEKNNQNNKEEHFESRIAELENELKQSRGSIEELTSTIASGQEENTALKKELSSYKELDKYIDTSDGEMITEGYDYSSLCLTYSDDLGRDALQRLADYRDGELSEQFASDAPIYTKLYQKGGPARKGKIGIWDWRVVPNLKDSSRDFIESVYNDRLQPIEVNLIRGKSSVSELVRILKEGLAYQPSTQRFFVCFFDGNAFWGFLLDSSLVFNLGNKLFINNDVVKLPVYKVYRRDIMFLDDIHVLRKMSVGKPERLVRIQDPLETIKDLVITRATWNAMNQIGISRAAYKQIKMFLSEMPNEELYTEIQNKCDCDYEEAKELLAAFVDNAEHLISGDTLENSVLAQVIRNDPDLYALCKNEIEVDWKEQNEQKIRAADDELKEIRLKVKESERIVEEKRTDLRQVNDAIKEAQEQLKSADALASSVETMVKDRIAKAREDAAAFIAENAFINPVALRADLQTEDTTGDCFIYEEKTLDPSVEHNSNWDDELKTIQIELQTTGVEDKYVNYLSGILYAAYNNRFALLLAGPYGSEIATALSYALSGHAPAILRCAGQVSQLALQKCLNSDAEIVLIENMFAPGWYETVLRLMEKKEKLYIAVHPFSEDLSIEPKGLLNYCLPVFTEQFVVNKPDDDYIGGIRTKEFRSFSSTEIERNYRKVCNKLQLNPSLSYKVAKILSDVHLLLDEKDYSLEIIMLFLPIAVVLGKETSLLSFIENNQDLVTNADQLQESINKMLGVSDEI